MSSPSHRLPFVGLLLASVLSASPPREASAQYSTWSGQAELFGGRFAPHGERTGLIGPVSTAAPVEMMSHWLLGGRLFFPVADTHRRNLGKVSLGFRGLLVPGADLKTAGYSGSVGTTDHYELLGTLSIGDFMSAGEGLNLLLNGMVGLGIGHTSYELDPGFNWSGGETSTTVPIFSVGLGGDVPISPWLSLVTSASMSWSLTKPDLGSVTGRCFSLVGGFSLRWPFGGE